MKEPSRPVGMRPGSRSGDAGKETPEEKLQKRALVKLQRRQAHAYTLTKARATSQTLPRTDTCICLDEGHTPARECQEPGPERKGIPLRKRKRPGTDNVKVCASSASGLPSDAAFIGTASVTSGWCG